MKSQIYDRFGGGLLLLIMLTIAVIASQAEPRMSESAAPVEASAAPVEASAAPVKHGVD